MSHSSVAHYVKAPFWKRFVSAVIDTIFVACMMIVLGVVFTLLVPFKGGSGAVLVFLIFLVIFLAILFLYEPLLLSWKGATIGKMAMHMWVVKDDGKIPSFGRAVLRTIAHTLSGSFFGLGYLWILFDKDHQSWHDKIAGTYVVQADNHNHFLEGKTPPNSGLDILTAMIYVLIIMGGTASRIQKLMKDPEFLEKWNKIQQTESRSPVLKPTIKPSLQKNLDPGVYPSVQ